MGLRGRLADQRRNPSLGPALPFFAFFWKRPVILFCSPPPPVQRPSHLPDNIPFALPVAQWGELSHGPSLASQKCKANETDARRHGVSEQCVAARCAAAFWPRPDLCPLDQGWPWATRVDMHRPDMWMTVCADSCPLLCFAGEFDFPDSNSLDLSGEAMGKLGPTMGRVEGGHLLTRELGDPCPRAGSTFLWLCDLWQVAPLL